MYAEETQQKTKHGRITATFFSFHFFTFSFSSFFFCSGFIPDLLSIQTLKLAYFILLFLACSFFSYVCSKCPLLPSYLLIDKLHCSRVLPSFRTLFLLFVHTCLVSSLKNVFKNYYKNLQSSLPSCVYYNWGIV